MVNLFPPPPSFDLPLSLGQDIIIAFNNKVPNSNPVEYVDFPAGTTVTLAIGKLDKVTSADAIIVGHTATVRIDSVLADDIKDKAPWRCIVSSEDGDDLVAINGKVVRHDGT